ncbi:DUF697 domain-containing protein [Hutsoniella sourekii]
MESWWQDIKSAFKWLAWGMGIVSLLFIVNQLAAIYRLLVGIHTYLAWLAVGLIALALIAIFWRLTRQWLASPELIELGENPSPEEYEQYLDDMIALLSKNTYLSDSSLLDDSLTKEERIQAGLKQLNEQSLPLIKENASAIFLSTAISQNGSLDSLVVLFSLVRMVWQLAGIYQTRPTLKSLGKLYLQVAGIVLMARTLEDTDLIEEQLEPLITSVLGESIASAIPGMVPVANLIVSSVMEGSVNAFLTLRVGLIAQTYLGNRELASKSTVRRSTSLQALSHMGQVLKDNGKTIAKTVARAAKNAGTSKAKRWFGV